MATTSIEWAEQVWNPLVGCTIKSAGCTNCYAMKMAARLALMGQKRYEGATKKIGKKAVWTGLVTPDADALTIPLRRKKPTTWFVNSMSDLFWGDDEDLASARAMGTADPRPVPFSFIAKVFGIMQRCPQHTFQILTKRPVRMAEFTKEWWGPSEDSPRGRIPLRNVWLGTSIESRRSLDRILPLRKSPAAVRFISFEPLLEDLGEVSLYRENEGGSQAIDWAIIGGESGPMARPCDIAWVRSLVKQCKAAGVAPFVKQLGAHVITRNDGYQGAPVRIRLSDRKGGRDMSEWPEDLRVRETPAREVVRT